MKKYPAIAILEFRDIAVGMHATDALLKKSPISLVKCGAISAGRYLTLIGGTTASVEESYNEGLYGGGANVVDHVLIPDIHPHLHDAVLGQRTPCTGGALVIIETQTASCNVRATELALKSTSVDLVEIRLADSLLHGKGVSIYHGALYDVEAAADIAVSWLREKQFDVMSRIITAPHDALSEEINAGTEFRSTRLMHLDGECL